MSFRPFNIDIPINNSEVILGKGIFFKYKSLDCKNFDFTIELIKNQRIYCPSPSQTNDKEEEFRPPISVGNYDDQTYKQKIRDWAFRVLKKSPPYPSDDEIEKEIATFTQCTLEKYAKEMTSSYHAQLDSDYRLISLSDNPFNTHLWDEYSDNFSGICLGIQIHHTLGAAHKVSYVENKPLWDLTSDEGMETLQASALTKLLKWKKEREYRIVLREPPLQGSQPLLNQKLIVPHIFFRSVYLGHRMSYKNKKLIIDLVGRHLPYTKIFALESSVPFKNPTLKML